MKVDRDHRKFRKEKQQIGLQKKCYKWIIKNTVFRTSMESFMMYSVRFISVRTNIYFTRFHKGPGKPRKFFNFIGSPGKRLMTFWNLFNSNFKKWNALKVGLWFHRIFNLILIVTIFISSVPFEGSQGRREWWETKDSPKRGKDGKRVGYKGKGRSNYCYLSTTKTQHTLYIALVNHLP